MNTAIDESAPKSGRLDSILRDLGAGGLKRARGLIETGKVFVDGRCQVDPATSIQAGQNIKLDWAAPNPQKKMPLGVRCVHIDDGLIIIDKPAGLLSTPTSDEERDTALSAARRLCRGGRPPLVVHRLDKDTSGLMVFARGNDMARRLRNLIEDREIERNYRCIVLGRPTPPSGLICSAILRDGGRGRRGSRRGSFDVKPSKATTPKPTTPHGKWAVTRYRTISSNDTYSALECSLETGRTHQIRIHLSELGCPIVGERVYARPHGNTRQALHAARLRLVHPLTESVLDFRSPWPEDLAVLLGPHLSWTSRV